MYQNSNSSNSLKAIALSLAIVMIFAMMFSIFGGVVQGSTVAAAENQLLSDFQTTLHEAVESGEVSEEILQEVAQTEPVPFTLSRTRSLVEGNSVVEMARFCYYSMPTQELRETVLAARSAIVGASSWTTYYKAEVFNVEDGSHIAYVPLYSDIFPYWDFHQISEFVFWGEETVNVESSLLTANSLIGIIPLSPLPWIYGWGDPAGDGSGGQLMSLRHTSFMGPTNPPRQLVAHDTRVFRTNLGVWSNNIPVGITYRFRITCRTRGNSAQSQNLSRGQGFRVWFTPSGDPIGFPNTGWRHINKNIFTDSTHTSAGYPIRVFANGDRL